MELQDIINRLASLDYVYNDETDAWLVGFITEKVVNHICNNCNLSEVPDGLKPKAVDMICGEFLKGKFAQGQLNVESIVTSIKEGDTQINFASGGTPEEIFIKYIEVLTTDNIDFARYRKLNWG